MRIAISSMGRELTSPVSSIFGRCAYYLFVDAETLAVEALANPAVGASSGAGVQAAQFVAEHGAQVVLTGNVGPNAMQVLQAASVSVYPIAEGSVQQALDAYKEGKLAPAEQATTAADTGKTTPPGVAAPDSAGSGGGRIGGGRGAGHGRGAGGGAGGGHGGGRR